MDETVPLSPLSETFCQAYEEIAEIHEGMVGPYICTGYKRLDYLIGGFFFGDLTLICGRPGIGKTTFVVNLIRNILKKGDSVGCFYLGESLKSFAIRYISTDTGMDFEKIFRGYLTDEEFVKIIDPLDDAEKMKLFISGGLSITLTDLLQGIETLCDKENTRIIFIDGFRNILLSGEITDIGEISRSLHDLAKKRNISIVMTCQLSRAIDLRQSTARSITTPLLSDISDTGALEQDAGMVLILHHESYYDSEEQATTLSIFAQKNKRGRKGAVDLQINFSKQRFLDDSQN